MGVIKFSDWIASAPSWIQVLPKGLQSLFFQLYQTFVYQDRWTWFADGLKITFSVTLGALALGILIGLIVAIIRTAHDSQRAGKNNPVLAVIDWMCRVYLTVIRGTPMMVQLLIMGFVVMKPQTEGMKLLCGIVTLGINSGAYVAEIARSGLMSIGVGQMEAGRSLGLNYAKTMWYIVIPQAVKNILPALGNEMITLLKDTSLVSVVMLRDVTKQAQNIVANTYQPFVPYIGLAVIYLVIVMILTKLLGILERRLRTGDSR